MDASVELGVHVGVAKTAIEQILVILPANDEEQHIARTVASLERAIEQTELAVTVVVALDRCTDDTELVGRRSVTRAGGATWIWMRCDEGRASSSRQVALEHALVDLGVSEATATVAVLSTDADTVVPSDWISHHVHRLDCGADARDRCPRRVPRDRTHRRTTEHPAAPPGLRRGHGGGHRRA